MTGIRAARGRLGIGAGVVLLLFASLGKVSAHDKPAVDVGEWQPLFAGVARAQVSASGKWLMRGQTLRIELTTPGLEFLSTPGNDDRPQDTDGQRTTTFLSKHGLQAAINAAPFSPVLNAENQPQDIIGLQISRGLLVSKPHPRFPALLISESNVATIASPPYDTKGIYNAVGGFGTVLVRGKLTGTADERHPRTAVGVTPDGRSMFWLVIDGRQPFYSDGATTWEVGQILLELGASEGINLDGGGTATLVIAERGRPQVLNRPIHLGLPGVERVSASHLGLRARPLSVVAKPKGAP